jgi:hypothetical protein
MQDISVYDLNGNTLSNLVQFDKDVYIYINDSRITAAYQVQFFNSASEVAYVVNSTYDNGILCVKIPNDLLVEPYAITGYVQIVASDGTKCLYGFKIAVRKKPKPSDWVYIDSHDYITFEEVIEECRTYAENANIDANNASESESNASKSAENAKNSEDAAANSAAAALASEQNSKSSEQAANSSETNAKHSEQESASSASLSKDYSDAARDSETNAKTSEENAKNSEDAAANSAAAALSSENESKSSEQAAGLSEKNAKTSESNAKDSEDKAKQYMTTILETELSSLDNAQKAESYAVGTGNSYRDNDSVDNAKYYYEQSKSISQGLSGALLPMGTIAYEQLATQEKQPGYMFNISNEFTTDSTFKEGAGVVCPAGTNVYYTYDGYWDCLAGSLVVGIKGEKETTYRNGNVNITCSDIGATTYEDGEAIKTDIKNINSDLSDIISRIDDVEKYDSDNTQKINDILDSLTKITNRISAIEQKLDENVTVLQITP